MALRRGANSNEDTAVLERLFIIHRLIRVGDLKPFLFAETSSAETAHSVELGGTHFSSV